MYYNVNVCACTLGEEKQHKFQPGGYVKIQAESQLKH